MSAIEDHEIDHDGRACLTRTFALYRDMRDDMRSDTIVAHRRFVDAMEQALSTHPTESPRHAAAIACDVIARALVSACDEVGDHRGVSLTLDAIICTVVALSEARQPEETEGMQS